MPLIKIQTSNSKPENVNGFLKDLSASLASHLGKPESYVMTALEDNVPMTFGGSTDPVCFVEIKNIGTMKPEQTKAMSADFCDKIEQGLGVSKNRIYIEFNDAQRHLWGWNGSTF